MWSHTHMPTWANTPLPSSCFWQILPPCSISICHSVMMQQKILNKSRDGHGSRCKHHVEKWNGRKQNALRTEGNEYELLSKKKKKKTRGICYLRDSKRSSRGTGIVWPYLELFLAPLPDSSIISIASLIPSSLHAICRPVTTTTSPVSVLCCRTQLCLSWNERQTQPLRWQPHNPPAATKNHTLERNRGASMQK